MNGNVNHDVQYDVIGLLNPQNIGGASYVICFIFESSRYYKVFITKNRIELSQCVKEIQAWIERASNGFVQCVH